MASQEMEYSQSGVHSFKDWKETWDGENTPVWHRVEVDMNLKKYLPKLLIGEKPSSILVSLCGKSVDLVWLCEQGHNVVGVEFSERAVSQFFEENCIPYSVTDTSNFKLYSANDRTLKVFVGDIYNFTPQIAGSAFDAVWDHNALGAVNPAERQKYIGVLQAILRPGGKILLSHFEYDPTEHCGPPFSLPPSLILALFKDTFNVVLLEVIDMTGAGVTVRFNLTWAQRPIHLLTYSLK